MPASATASQAYSSGARKTAPKPPSTASTAPLVSTANSASDEPATTANSTGAAGPPDQSRAPSTHNTKIGPITTATATQVPSEPRSLPALGSPTVTRTANAAASSTAHIHSDRVTR